MDLSFLFLNRVVSRNDHFCPLLWPHTFTQQRAKVKSFVCAYSKHDCAWRVKDPIMQAGYNSDGLPLFVSLEGEVFKGHDSGFPRLQDVDVYTNTEAHSSLSSVTQHRQCMHSIFTYSMWNSSYGLSSRSFAALHQFLPLFSLYTKLIFTHSN